MEHGALAQHGLGTLPPGAKAESPRAHKEGEVLDLVPRGRPSVWDQDLVRNHPASSSPKNRLSGLRKALLPASFPRATSLHPQSLPEQSRPRAGLSGWGRHGGKKGPQRQGWRGRQPPRGPLPPRAPSSGPRAPAPPRGWAGRVSSELDGRSSPSASVALLP